MKLFSYTTDQLTPMANDVLDAYLGQLAANNIITVEQYGELMNYRVVVSEASTFGQLWRKWFKKELPEGELTYTLGKTFEKKDASN